MIETRSHCLLEGNRGSSWACFQTDLDALPQKRDLEKLSLGVTCFPFNWSLFPFWSSQRTYLKKKKKKNYCHWRHKANDSITNDSCKTCQQTKSAQRLLANLIYKSKPIKIGSSRIENIIDVFVHYTTCFIFEMLLYRIPFLDFPVLDVQLGDCCISISI